MGALLGLLLTPACAGTGPPSEPESQPAPAAPANAHWGVPLGSTALGWPAAAPGATGACTVSDGGNFSREVRIRDCHPSEIGKTPIDVRWRLPATRVDVDLVVLADGSSSQWMRLEGVPANALLPKEVLELPARGQTFAWPPGWARFARADREQLAAVVGAEPPDWWDLGREASDTRDGELRFDQDPTRWSGSRAKGMLSFREGGRWYLAAWEQQHLSE